MNDSAETFRKAVSERAGFRCEYCHATLNLPSFPPQLDHVVARQHGGKTILQNLALACRHCNLHKGPNLAGMDSKSKRPAFLFNPREDDWSKHFRRNGPVIMGKTAKGRATAATLQFNSDIQIEFRLSLIDEGLIPTRE